MPILSVKCPKCGKPLDCVVQLDEYCEYTPAIVQKLQGYCPDCDKDYVWFERYTQTERWWGAEEVSAN